MNASEAAQPGIRRLDDDRHGTHGWAVCVQRRHRVFTKFFADGRHGGKQRALEAARSHRDQLLCENPALLRREYASILRKNNTSGVPGVCRCRERQGNLINDYWLAFWPTGSGKRRQVKFSIARYGEEKAFALAVAARERALAQLDEPWVRSLKKRRAPGHRVPATTSPPAPDLRITRATVQRHHLRVEIHDQRVITVPLSWFPLLQAADPAARQDWVVSKPGDTITWPQLGLAITAAELLKV